MVEAMRPGSVVVDLAAESGGNCELSVPGEDVEHRGVLVHGMQDAPSSMPVHASQLYARNVVNLLLLMTETGRSCRTSTTRSSPAACVTRPGRTTA